jgi:hypothetical protein
VVVCVVTGLVGLLLSFPGHRLVVGCSRRSSRPFGALFGSPGGGLADS